MQFNSLEFLIFLPVIAILYFALPHKYRWGLLLAASCFFFGFFYYSSFDPLKETPFFKYDPTKNKPVIYYIILTLSIISVILVNYFMAIIIDRAKTAGSGRAKLYLVIGIIYTLLLLFVFKYFNFFSQTVSDIALFLDLRYPPRILKILVPVGISYYTFQSISYLVDVYRGTMKPERHLGILSLYILFFPKIVAGPIERPQKLIKQFYEEHQFDYKQVMDGLKLMAWGFFQKIVIADRAAIVANDVFSNPKGFLGIYLIIASLCFIFQVFCDFAGYSNIAIGTAQIFGIKLTQNFKRPYLSPSIPELWRRWHITLIAWFRDYVYIPLGGNRVAQLRWQFNIFTIFFLSGIWHGANWTFIIWASLNGFYSLASIWTKNIRRKLVTLTGLSKVPRLHNVLKIVNTFLLFTFAGIFFRADKTSDGFYIITNLFSGFGGLIQTLMTMNVDTIKAYIVIQNKTTFLGFAKPAFLPEMITLALAIMVHGTIEIIQEVKKQSMREIISQKPWYVQIALYYCLLFSIVFLGMSGQQFLYFVF